MSKITSRSEQLKSEGDILLKQGHYEQAIKKYNKAIQLNPRNAIYYANRAAAYTYLSIYQPAANDSRRSTEINPNYITGYVREGIAEYKLKNYKAAYIAYSNALGRTNKSDRNWFIYHNKTELCLTKMRETDNISDEDEEKSFPKITVECGNEHMFPPDDVYMEQMEQRHHLLDDMKTEQLMKLEDDRQIKGDSFISFDFNSFNSFNSFHDFYVASVFGNETNDIGEDTRTEH
eukprot:380272_1